MLLCCNDFSPSGLSLEGGLLFRPADFEPEPYSVCQIFNAIAIAVQFLDSADNRKFQPVTAVFTAAGFVYLVESHWTVFRNLSGPQGGAARSDRRFAVRVGCGNDWPVLSEGRWERAPGGGQGFLPANANDICGYYATAEMQKEGYSCQ